MQIEYKYLADFPELVPCCAQWSFSAWGKYNPAATLQKRIDSFRKHCNKNMIPLTILAMAGGKIIGMASLRENDGAREDLCPWLGSLYIDKRFRGQDIGRSLIGAIKNKALELGYRELYLLTYEKSLVSWYESLNWEKTGEGILSGSPITIMRASL